MSPRQAFNLNGYWPVKMQQLDFPDAAYDNDPNLKIKIDFITPRTARIRMFTTPVEPKNTDQDDVMLCDGFKAKGNGKMWRTTQSGDAITYTSDFGSIEIKKYPWRLVIKDAKGKVLTQTRHIIDNDSSQVKLQPPCADTGTGRTHLRLRRIVYIAEQSGTEGASECDRPAGP